MSTRRGWPVLPAILIFALIPGSARVDAMESAAGDPAPAFEPGVACRMEVRGVTMRFTRNGLDFEVARPALGRSHGIAEASFSSQGGELDESVLPRLDFVGASEDVEIEGCDGVGNALGVAGPIVYRGLWPGVDLVFRSEPGRLKYELDVAPGADPSRIAFAYRRVEGIGLSDTGDLVVRTGSGEMRDEKPSLFQWIDGRKVRREGRFRISGTSGFGFEIPSYDPSYPLVVDPSIRYSTFLGGTDYETGTAIAADSAGNTYVAGWTNSADFPTDGPYQATYAGTVSLGGDAFVTKFNQAADYLGYSTYLGGSNREYGRGIAVDSAGSAYVTGETWSTNFPTASAYQATRVNGPAYDYDAFVTKLSTTGDSLVYSSYLGGSGGDSGYGIAVDSSGRAYVTGYTDSDDFPMRNAYQGTRPGGTLDVFVTRFNAILQSSLSYSTYLGGSGNEEGRAIAVKSDGVAYVTGWTDSSDFPTENAYQGALAETYYFDAFVTKLAFSGSSLWYSTYLGGEHEDEGRAIAVDSSGKAYVTGWTESEEFPTIGAYQTSYNHAGCVPAYGCNEDAFVTKLSLYGTFLDYSTYLGGDSDDFGYGIAVDSTGGAYVTGNTTSTDFPRKSPYQAALAGVGPWYGDAFVAKLAPSGGSLGYSTYLGGTDGDQGSGIAVDSSGRAYVAGVTESSDYPTKSPFDGTYTGGYDAFMTRFPGRGVSLGSADYDGDHQDEIGVFRNGMWFLSYSNAYAAVDQATAFGSPTFGADLPQIGEFGCAVDAKIDGQTDLVILRKASSTWQATFSSDWGSTPDFTKTFGTTNHKRIPTQRLDTNGDGCSDIGVFRNGCFDILDSPWFLVVGTHVCFGLGADEPLAADLNGDGKSDLILWRAATAHYSFRLSPGYGADDGADLGAGDYPLLGDFDSDGMADLGSYKQSTSTFRFTYSPTFVGVDLQRTHGVSGDIPVIADVNGDGVSDIGIFRNSNARWWFRCSTTWNTTCLSQSFGQAGDIPIYGKPPGMP